MEMLDFAVQHLKKHATDDHNSTSVRGEPRLAVVSAPWRQHFRGSQELLHVKQ